MTIIKLVKRGYSCIPLLTVPIQTKRARLLNDADFIDVCRAAHNAPEEPVPFAFDVFMRVIVWTGNTRKLNRQIKSKTGRELLRSAYTAGQMGESFETWKKSMK